MRVFAEACAEAGLVFVGPPASAIRAMGSKSAAKALMEKAGVPLVPGYHGTDQAPGLLEAEAARIGYPVLIKASAGGGGKGMRIVTGPGAFAEALAVAKGEALSAFGDDQVLVERYLTRPRHIEIQVFADQAGQTVSLFRARLLHPAAAPEGGGGGAGARPLARAAGAHGRGGVRGGPGHRLRGRRHGGVHRRCGCSGPVLLHGDEHPGSRWSTR